MIGLPPRPEALRPLFLTLQVAPLLDRLSDGSFPRVSVPDLQEARHRPVLEGLPIHAHRRPAGHQRGRCVAAPADPVRWLLRERPDNVGAVLDDEVERAEERERLRDRAGGEPLGRERGHDLFQQIADEERSTASHGLPVLIARVAEERDLG